MNRLKLLMVLVVINLQQLPQEVKSEISALLNKKETHISIPQRSLTIEVWTMPTKEQDIITVKVGLVELEMTRVKFNEILTK